MQTHPVFFRAAALMSLLLAAESRAQLPILYSNLEMMAGQPSVGVLNLTLWPVSVGLTTFAACPACGEGKWNRDPLLCLPGLQPRGYILVCFPICVFSREPSAKLTLLCQGRKSVLCTLGLYLISSFCGKRMYLRYTKVLLVVF